MRLKPLPLIACLATAPALLLAEDAPAPSCGTYTCNAHGVRVIDGDTIVADIDRGFSVWRHEEHLRLVGIDAPENNSPSGETVTAILKGLVEGRDVVICTVKAKRSDPEAAGSFDRYLATLYLEGGHINAWLLAEGHALPWGG